MKNLKLLLLALCIPWLNVYAQNVDLTEGKQIDLNGTELFVKTVGKGEPIIIIHGGPMMDHSYLLSHLESLSPNHQLIFYDQRLNGRSSADVDSTEIRINKFIEDIEALRTYLDLNHVHLLGHSWGGLLAMKYAIGYPNRTESLMLINSMPPSSELWHKEEAILSTNLTKGDSLARQEIMQSDLFKAGSPKAIEQLLLLSFKKQFYNPKLIDSLDLYVPQDYMSRSRLLGNLMTDITQYNLLEDLERLSMPALVIYGASEPASGLSGPVLDETIPDSKLIIIKKSGHFPFIEQPDEFRKTIRNFLSTLPKKNGNN